MSAAHLRQRRFAARCFGRRHRRGAADRRRRVRCQNRGGWLARRLCVLGANPGRRVDADYDSPAYCRALGRARRARDRAGRGRGTAAHLARHSVVRSPFPCSIRGRQHPASIKPDVLSYYLNTPAFIVRSLVALGRMVRVSRCCRLRPAAAAASSWPRLDSSFMPSSFREFPLDWYLSLEAPFTSSSFGASVAISAWSARSPVAAATVPAAADDPAIGDLGGLLLATSSASPTSISWPCW